MFFGIFSLKGLFEKNPKTDDFEIMHRIKGLCKGLVWDVFCDFWFGRSVFFGSGEKFQCRGIKADVFIRVV